MYIFIAYESYPYSRGYGLDISVAEDIVIPFLRDIGLSKKPITNTNENHLPKGHGTR